jgi:hypothetical protein
MRTYTVEKKSPDLLWLRGEHGLVGIVEHRATGWVARPCEAGRRPSTKRWTTAANAALSMWGLDAAHAIEAVS